MYLWGVGLPNPSRSRSTVCRPPGSRHPMEADSQMQIPPGCRPPLDADPTRCRPHWILTPTGCKSLWMQTPGHVTVMEAGKPIPLLLCTEWHTRVNHILSQTSFAGGNYTHWSVRNHRPIPCILTHSDHANCPITRMHSSSRMRTGRTLTIFRCLVPGGGGGVYPQRKQKSKKNSPPKKLTPINPPQPHTPPQKMETTPPEKLETPPPQKKIGEAPRTRPPQDWLARHAGIPTQPLWTDRRLWKYYLGQNFVSAGKNTDSNWFIPFCDLSQSSATLMFSRPHAWSVPGCLWVSLAYWQRTSSSKSRYSMAMDSNTPLDIVRVKRTLSSFVIIQ